VAPCCAGGSHSFAGLWLWLMGKRMLRTRTHPLNPRPALLACPPPWFLHTTLDLPTCFCNHPPHVQLGNLVVAMKERAVDWDLMVVETSNLDRKAWLRALRPPADPTAQKSLIPDVGDRVVYFGGGHASAVATAIKILKREAAAVKKSVDSKRRRERERRERERERERQQRQQAQEEAGEGDGAPVAASAHAPAAAAAKAKKPARKKKPPSSKIIPMAGEVGVFLLGASGHWSERWCVGVVPFASPRVCCVCCVSLECVLHVMWVHDHAWCGCASSTPPPH
jgi:hypothetical protein